MLEDGETSRDISSASLGLVTVMAGVEKLNPVASLEGRVRTLDYYSQYISKLLGLGYDMLRFCSLTSWHFFLSDFLEGRMLI